MLPTLILYLALLLTSILLYRIAVVYKILVSDKWKFITALILLAKCFLWSYLFYLLH